MRYLLVIVLLCCTGVVSAQRNAAKGDRYFNQNLFEEAIKYYELELDKGTDRDAKNHSKKQLAECYRIIGEFEQAEKAYQKVLKKKSNREDPTNFLNYGKSLKASAKFEEAKVQFQEFINLRPDDPRGPVFLQSCDSAQLWLDQTLGKDVNNLTLINTEESEFAPVFVAPGVLLFSSSREGSKEAFISFNGGFQINHLDLYSVGVEGLSKDSVGELGRHPINSPNHEGPATFSSDGTEMYFTRTVKGERNARNNKIVNTLQVFYSRIDSTGNWTEPTSAFEFNSLRYSVGHPSLTPDGQTIYFMSDMNSGEGKTDIYFCEKDSAGVWGAPINLGDQVNTFGYELFPHVAANGKLYFSSDSHPGMGKLDIFVCDIKNGKGVNVQNLKPPINSIGDDFGIVFDGEHNRGFFSSDRFNGAGAEDLYSFSNDVPLLLSFKGNQLQIADTRVYDGLKYLLMEGESGEVLPLEARNGLFTYTLQNDTKYVIEVKQSFFAVNRVSITLNQGSDGKVSIEVTSTSLPVQVGGTLLKHVPSDTLQPFHPLQQQTIQLKENSAVLKAIQSDDQGQFKFGTLLDPEKVYLILSE